MKLNAEQYRQAYEQYRQWNEAELVDKARNAGRLTPEQAWQQYIALVEFCWKMCPHHSTWQRNQKLASLDRYYAAVQKLETWRHARGKAA